MFAETNGLITGNQLYRLLQWDKSQFNPVHSGDIIFIALLPGFNYNLITSVTSHTNTSNASDYLNIKKCSLNKKHINHIIFIFRYFYVLKDCDDLTNEEIESECGRYVVAYNGWIMNTNLAHFYNFITSESSVSKLNYYMHASM